MVILRPHETKLKLENTVNRFMVALGIGTLILGTSVQADFPVSIQGEGSPQVGQMGQGIAWHTDLRSGWLEAKRRNLPMLIFITSDSCIYCDAMKKNTWCNPTVQNRLAGKFVAIKLHKNRNQETLSRIKVDTYPTTLMGLPKGKIIGHRLGYQPPDALQAFLSEAKTLVNSNMTANNVH